MTTTDTPRTDAYQYANYILNHYDPSSHKDKLCLAKSLIEHGYGAAKPKLTRESYDENWNMKQADTPRTDAVQFQKKPISLSIENEMLRALSREIERELTASKAEVERLNGLVMEAAQKGDELLEPHRLRAEKAETLLKQIHAFVEALNTTNK